MQKIVKYKIINLLLFNSILESPNLYNHTVEILGSL
jgi:hypothetical protein